MIYTINELKQKVFSKVFDTYEIFQNFFGEDFTDIQAIPSDEVFALSLLSININMTDNRYDLAESQLAEIQEIFSNYDYDILVWWPSVTVTNENDKSINIQDLYAKIKITIEGTIPYENVGFQLTRSTVSLLQFKSGYLHSHLPRCYNSVPVFKNPCLGNGPIRNTIADLKNNYEEVLWMLFCRELSLYVTVESLRGGPYIRLETVGYGSKSLLFTGYENTYFPSLNRFYNQYTRQAFFDMLQNFFEFYIKNNHLSFSYTNERYICGMSYYDYIIDVSNSFIAWYNSHSSTYTVSDLYDNTIILKSFISDGVFYDSGMNDARDIENFRGSPVLVFKGNTIAFEITESSSENEHISILLNHKIAMYLLTNLLNIINYHYGNEQYTNDTTIETRSTPSTASGSIFYI